MARLVFCEDDGSIRRLIEVALRSTPHEIHVAADGVEGFALVERLRPDAVFTDLQMPKMGGLTLCRMLKARADLGAIPIVVVTASAQRAEIEEVEACGVAAVLRKPFSPAALRGLVERVLAEPR